MANIEKKVRHNDRVINDALTALIESRMVEPIRLVTDPEYTTCVVSAFIDAQNIARKAMNLPKVELYNLYEED